MTVQVQQVPVTGFQPQAPSTPTAPADTPSQQGFAPVPPAGNPPRPPNGNTIDLAGQVPGFVPRPPAQVKQPEPQAPAQTLDAAGIAALIQNALGQQPPPAQPKQTESRPSWMQTPANQFDVESIKDPVIKSMAGILQTVGKDLDLDRVIGRALAHNDASLIDEAYLAEKGGANAQQLAQIARGIVQAVSAKADEIQRSVHALVGGEANWSAAVAAFNTKAPQELRVTVARMLDSTDEQFITAGAKIVAEFAKNSGLTPQPAALLQNGAASVPAAHGLSREQFQAELVKLDKYSPEYGQRRAELFARRSVGKRNGM